MPTTLNFKNIIDVPMWRPAANSIAAAGAGACTAFDPREKLRNPYMWHFTAATVLSAHHAMNDEWIQLASPGMAGTFGAGACAVFHGAGPSGNINSGSTTTKVVLSTALPATVGPNQLANRGDGKGFYVRIVGKAAGKTETRFVVGNTGGTAPTITLDSALSFTPALNDTYEFLSGRVFLLSAGVLAAGIFKYYDVLTNSYSGNLATTNLPATIGTDSSMVALCEQFTPWNKDGEQGYLGQMTATASTTTTLTGTAAGADAAVLGNEYARCQIRIVQDTTTPAAVGQRRVITSHTAGPSPVYTVPTWTTQPSSSAQFVIENDNDKIILFSSASASTYNYNITANTWDTTTWAARGSAVGAGVTSCLAYGITPDADKNARPTTIYSFRGGGNSAIDALDITTNTWTNAIAYGNSGAGFTTGSCSMYDANTNNGQYMYVNQSGTQRMYRFDVKNRVLEPWCYMPFSQGGAVVGERMGQALFSDDFTSPTATKVAFLTYIRSSGQEVHQTLIQR